MSDAQQQGGVLQWVAGLILGTFGGSFGTVVAHRTRLSNMARDIKDEKEARERLESDLAGEVRRISRRQTDVLKIVANIARKVGVDGREFDDALVRMLADDTD